MSNFDGLIFLTQLQQNSRLADMRDGIDAVHAQLGQLQRHHAQAAQAQKRLEYFRQEIYTFGQHLHQTSQDIQKTAGLACYWSFRFLLWSSQESVQTKSFADYTDKRVFSEVLQRAHDILNHSAKHYYTQEELCRIERAMFLDCGGLSKHKEYLHWSKIRAIASKYRFLFSTMDFIVAATGVLLIPIPGVIAVMMLCKEWGYPRSVLDWVVAGGIGLAVTPIAGGLLALIGKGLMKLIFLAPILKRNRIVEQRLQPLAADCGGTIENEVSLRTISHHLSSVQTSLRQAWGNVIHVHDSLDDIERYHQALTDEYLDTKERLIDVPPCVIPPHIRDLEPLIPERRESK